MKRLSLFLALILSASILFAQELPQVPDDILYELQFQFNGQWLPSVDPSLIGPENYQTLQNMRYTPTGGLEGVSGYSKINSNAISGTPEIDTGYHFKKDNPFESHVIVSADGTIYENTTAIPGTGDFVATALYTEVSGPARFAASPFGSVAHANGEESTIWGGNEIPSAAFLTSSAAVTAHTLTHPKDYSFAVNNDLTTSDNVVIIGGEGGQDSNTKILIHSDTTDGSVDFADATGNHSPAGAGGDEHHEVDQKKFGSTSIYMPNAGDYLTVADSADFDILGGDFTIDFWVRHTDVTATRHYVGQYESGNDSWGIYWAQGGPTLAVNFTESAASVFYYTCPWTPSIDTWYHLAFVRSTNTHYIFIDGVSQPLTLVAGAYANTGADIVAQLTIGDAFSGGGTLYGYLDEFRMSDTARWTTTFTPPTRPYAVSSKTWLVGSPRPLKGVKFYVSSANTEASTMTAKEWNGSVWNSLSITDNTDTGASLAKTDTVTWSSTVDTSKVKFIENRLYYWYQFAIDAGDATIYKTTLNAPWQPIVDIWDGVPRQPTQFQAYKSAKYEDYTLEVNDPDATYYGDLGGLTSSEWLIVMFDERQTALKWIMVPGKENTTAATATIYYWNGSEWTTVGAVADTTLDEAGSTKSLGQSGVMSWEPPAIALEFVRTLFGVTGYAYKLKWSDTLTASNAQVNVLTGVPAQHTVIPAKFPVTYKDRLFLCGYTEGGEGNRCDFSAPHSPQIFNGQESSNAISESGESQTLYFGGEEELSCAIELYNRIGSNIFDFLIALKNNETYVAYGDGPVFSYSKVSGNVGCPAPYSLVTGEVAFSVSTDVERNIAMWVSYAGPVIFDGAVIYKIPGLETYFDPVSSNYLGRTAIEGAIGFFDQTYGEYNIIIGANWFVYNLKLKRWFLKTTSAAKTPISAWPVRDTYGNQFIYAGLDNGFMVRLENGTSWDGTGIIQSVKTGDFFPTKSLWDVTNIRRLKLVYAGLSNSNSVSVTHYKDTEASGTATLTQDMVAATARIYRATEDVNFTGWSHSLLFTATTDDESKGFQPLGWAVQYSKVRKDE
uniref:Putative structural protein n=1 Tax=viral metagenome TaxID=1070528 RepID=A0A6M3J4C2_9ZZZZ